MIINKNGILTRHNDDMRFISSFPNENGEEAKELAVVKYFDSIYLLTKHPRQILLKQSARNQPSDK